MTICYSSMKLTEHLTLQEAQEFIDEENYDLFIFDINVPGKSGVELIEELRSFNDTTPAIIITAYEDVDHMKNSFDAGAHDYIKKPFDLEELKLRIEKSKILFHIEQDTPEKLSETVMFYPSKRVIKNSSKTYTLKPKEQEILAYFIAHPTDSFPRKNWCRIFGSLMPCRVMQPCVPTYENSER